MKQLVLSGQVRKNNLLTTDALQIAKGVDKGELAKIGGT